MASCDFYFFFVGEKRFVTNLKPQGNVVDAASANKGSTIKSGITSQTLLENSDENATLS